MGSSPSPPPVYNNPSTVIPQAQQSNLQTAQEQAGLNNVSQYNPTGSTVYTPNGMGGYNLTQSLSQPYQSIYNSATGAAGNLAQQAESQYSNPANINPSSAVNSAVGMYQQYMDPYWQQQQSNLNSNLESQGLNPNDQAYKMAQLGLQQGQQSQVGQEIATLEPQMYQQALQSYELPAQTLAAMEGTVPSVSTTSTPQTGVSPVDVTGAYNDYQQALNQQYQSQMQQYAAQQGGMFGLGGSVLGGLAGGWARNGFSLGGGSGLGSSVAGLASTAMPVL